MIAPAYAWLITHDHICDDDSTSDAGTCGPFAVTLSREEIRNHADVRAFRMFDDDGEHYYTGCYVGPDDETLFAPLDDFGTPNAGCTRIDYRDAETGAWETL